MIIDDVQAQFQKIPKKVRKSSFFGSTKRYLGARNTKIPWPDYTSQIFHNKAGHLEHFQGVQRIRNRLILSGGINKGERGSQLIVLEMETREKKGPWSLPKYDYSYKNPPILDVTVEVIDLDKRKWHAGGIQAIEDVVAVPIYGDSNRSEIWFVHIRGRDEAPRKIPKLIKSHSQSKAVAVTRLPEQRYGGLCLLVIWDDEHLDFHFSNGKALESGFADRATRLHKSEIGFGFIVGAPFLSGSYQSINLVVGRDGSIYLIAARNSSGMSPTITGSDFADLYRISWPGGDTGRKPRISFAESKQMYCYNQQCNFGAAAGIYLDDEFHMFLYAASHWLHDGNRRINFNEYSYT